MSLLHLFKLPHNDAEQNQVPILLWLHDNILPVHGWSRSLLVFFKFCVWFAYRLQAGV